MSNKTKTNIAFLSFQIVMITLVVEFQNNTFFMISTLVTFIIINFYFEKIIFKLGIISKLPETIKFSNNTIKSFYNKIIKTGLFTCFSLIGLILTFIHLNKNLIFLYIAFALCISTVIYISLIIKKFKEYEKF